MSEPKSKVRTAVSFMTKLLYSQIMTSAVLLGIKAVVKILSDLRRGNIDRISMEECQSHFESQVGD